MMLALLTSLESIHETNFLQIAFFHGQIVDLAAFFLYHCENRRIIPSKFRLLRNKAPIYWGHVRLYYDIYLLSRTGQLLRG